MDSCSSSLSQERGPLDIDQLSLDRKLSPCVVNEAATQATCAKETTGSCRANNMAFRGLKHCFLRVSHFVQVPYTTGLHFVMTSLAGYKIYSLNQPPFENLAYEPFYRCINNKDHYLVTVFSNFCKAFSIQTCSLFAGLTPGAVAGIVIGLLVLLAILVCVPIIIVCCCCFCGAACCFTSSKNRL